MFELDKLVHWVRAAFDAYSAMSDLAERVADDLAEQGQPELKQALAELRKENDAAWARRHAKLQAAAKQ